MDPGSLSLSLGAVIVCLLAAPRCSSADKNNCSCAEIPEVPLTKPPPQTCSDTFRYTCEDGYVRKVGTSNRIKCTRSANGAPKWDKPKMKCIRDPRIKTTTCPPAIPVTTGSFTDLQMNGSGGFSPTLESNSVEPTSLGVQTDRSQATFGTASTNQSSGNSSNNHHVSGYNDLRLGTTGTALIVCASLVITGALIGISYTCYRRRSRNSTLPATDEEKMSMSNVAAGPASESL